MNPAAGRHVMGRRLFVAAAAAAIGARAFPLEMPPAAALIARILELRRGSVVRARGRLVVTDARNRQRVFQILVLQKPLARSLNLLWQVTAPPEALTRILVESPFEGRPTLWLASGANGTPAVLPAQRWADPILGSQLAFEDLVDDHLAWPEQAVTGEEAVSGKMCFVLRSAPAAGRSPAYGSVTTWVDEATLLPLRTVKQPRGSGAPKEIVCRGARQSAQRWTASTIEVRIRGGEENTRVVFTAGSARARVTDREVDPKFAFGPEGDGR
jgi:hypothetical protein